MEIINDCRVIEMYYRDNEKFADLINEKKYYEKEVLKADLLRDCDEEVADIFDFDVPTIFKEDNKKVYILLLLDEKKDFREYELKAMYCSRDLEWYYGKSMVLTMIYVNDD